MDKNELHGGAHYVAGKIEKAVGDAARRASAMARKTIGNSPALWVAGAPIAGYAIGRLVHGRRF